MTALLLSMLTMSTVLGFGNSRRLARQADDDCAKDNTLTYSMTLAGDGKGNSANQLNNPRGEIIQDSLPSGMSHTSDIGTTWLQRSNTRTGRLKISNTILI